MTLDLAVAAPAPSSWLGGRLLGFWRTHGVVRLLFRRAGAMVVLCFGITLVAFVLTHLVPGDPVAANLGPNAIANPAIVAAYKAQYGLDKPLPVQYEVYLTRLLHGDLGVSQLTARPVATDLGQFIPASFELGLLAMAIATVVGVSLGLVGAVGRGSAIDQALRVFSLAGISTPPFWIGLIALYVFTFVLRVAPSSGQLSAGALPPAHVTGMYLVDALLAGDPALAADALHHLILPAVVLAIGFIGVLQRFTRAAVLEIIHNDYITAARAKGLPSFTILRRYTLRAALAPILTVSGLLFANVVTGTVLVETVFAWPGVGYYAAQTALKLDVTAITGVGMFVAIVYVATNSVVDVLHALIDPRVRLM